MGQFGVNGCGRAVFQESRIIETPTDETRGMDGVIVQMGQNVLHGDEGFGRVEAMDRKTVLRGAGEREAGRGCGTLRARRKGLGNAERPRES